MQVAGGVAAIYRDFAKYTSDSPCFHAWALGVAGDPEVQRWIEALPPHKQVVPTLVFAAARWHGVAAPGPYAGLRDALLADDGEIRATIMTRATQTNEVGRLATIMPALAQIAERSDQSISLIEIGASAGLCLFPDRYDYRWPPVGELDDSGGPQLVAAAYGPLPVPTQHPTVAWRAGLDLNPLDVADDDAMAWLKTLIWPEHDERRSRLTQAITIARSDPPRLQRGNLLEDLDPLVDEAADHGTVVVFHSAVAVYLAKQDRDRFTAQMIDRVRAGRCHWISNEAPNVLPALTATGPSIPDDMATFVLGLDGRAVALTHQHGASIRWL